METRNSLAHGKKKGVALPVNSPVVVSPRAFLTALPRGHFAMETALDERASVITVRTPDSPFRAFRSDLEAEHPGTLTLNLAKIGK